MEQFAVSDRQLLDSYCAGDVQAFEELMARYEGALLAFATRFLGDPSMGRDAAQDVFLSLWSERHRYESRGRFRAYLLSVTRNRCRYLARSRSHIVRWTNQLVAEGETRIQEAQEPERAGSGEGC